MRYRHHPSFQKDIRLPAERLCAIRAAAHRKARALGRCRHHDEDAPYGFHRMPRAVTNAGDGKPLPRPAPLSCSSDDMNLLSRNEPLWLTLTGGVVLRPVKQMHDSTFEDVRRIRIVCLAGIVIVSVGLGFLGGRFSAWLIPVGGTSSLSTSLGQVAADSPRQRSVQFTAER